MVHTCLVRSKPLNKCSPKNFSGYATATNNMAVLTFNLPFSHNNAKPTVGTIGIDTKPITAKLKSDILLGL